MVLVPRPCLMRRAHHACRSVLVLMPCGPRGADRMDSLPVSHRLYAFRSCSSISRCWWSISSPARSSAQPVSWQTRVPRCDVIEFCRSAPSRPAFKPRPRPRGSELVKAKSRSGRILGTGQGDPKAQESDCARRKRRSDRLTPGKSRKRKIPTFTFMPRSSRHGRRGELEFRARSTGTGFPLEISPQPSRLTIQCPIAA